MHGIVEERVGYRWLGDAASVSAEAKGVVKVRTDAETGEPTAVRIPDHLDILVRAYNSNPPPCVGKYMFSGTLLFKRN